MNWLAKWVWADGEASPRNEWRCFRKTFDAPANGWSSAHIAMTADSRYVLYVNGESIGRGPNRSWPLEQSYDVYDISHLLHPGQKNVIAVLVLHYGVSNWSYVRGRGGLLAQLDLQQGEENVHTWVTDVTWKTSRYEGHDRHSPRMSFQQAFTEKIDARLWGAEWVDAEFDDTDWRQTLELGPVGTEPWTKLVQRDIPFLSEETVYPVRVECLHKVRPVSWTATVDVRNHMVPGSENHANPMAYVGYIATVIRAPERATCTFGFFNTHVFGPCTVNGVRYEMEQFVGTLPERYLEVELKQGDNLFVMDITGRDIGGIFHMAIDCAVPVEVVSPVLPPLASDVSGSPFATIGPFDSEVLIDHQESREMACGHKDYLAAKTIASLDDLRRFTAWIRPVASSLVSRENVFVLCVWKKRELPMSVPAALQQVVTANNMATEVPVYPDADTELVIDFGRELSGYLSFEVDASAGTILDFYGFEYMRDGLRQDTFDLDNTLRYICRDGRQRYTSPIRRGIRYVMLTVRANKPADSPFAVPNALPHPVRIYSVRWIQSSYPVAEVGRFQSSDAKLNDIWAISRDTTRLCMQDTFVDCPAYEQVFWVGDSRNEALFSYYLFGAEPLVKRGLRLVPGSRLYTPLYTTQVPSGWNSVIPNWTFFWVFACWEYYERTGDCSFAAEMWPHIRKTLDHYLAKIGALGMLNIKAWNFLDWAPVDQPQNGVVAHQNMFFVKALHTAAEFGENANDRTAVVYYREAAERLRQAINRHLWAEGKQAYADCLHADGSLSTTFSMQTQTVAYLCDIPYGERTAPLERYLLDPPPAFVQLGSPFMSFFYYAALAKLGRFQRIIDDMRVQFGYMIDYGATTCWEMFPNSQEGLSNPNYMTRSHCHAWSAAPVYFLGAYVLGIRSAGTGWRKVTVQPQPCGLTWARGSVPLPENGRIDVAWHLADDGRTMYIQVWAPAEVELEVRVPEGMESRIDICKL